MNLLNPWVILGIILLCAASFFGGGKVESDHRDAQLLTQEREYHSAFVQRAATLRTNADTVSTQLNKETRLRDADRVEFSNKLLEAINAKILTKCEAAETPDGEPVVLINVGVWNSALTIGPGPSGDPRGTDGAAIGAGFANAAEAVANLGENATRWSTCRAQVTGWQALARKNGWVK